MNDNNLERGHITVMVYTYENPDRYGVNPIFVAFPASNPEFRIQGTTEAEVLEKLKQKILNYMISRKTVKIIELTFNDLIVEEIMGL